MSETASVSNAEQVRRFVFSSKDKSQEHETVEILIPEVNFTFLANILLTLVLVLKVF